MKKNILLSLLELALLIIIIAILSLVDFNIKIDFLQFNLIVIILIIVGYLVWMLVRKIKKRNLEGL